MKEFKFLARNDWVAGEIEDRKTQDGLRLLQLGYDEVEKLSAALQRGRIPAAFVNAVVGEIGEIQTLHPDKYPFDISVYGVLNNGLENDGFNSARIWGNLRRSLRRRKAPHLVDRYSFGNANDAVIGFLVDYALTKQDIPHLSRTRTEINF